MKSSSPLSIISLFVCSFCFTNSVNANNLFDIYQAAKSSDPLLKQSINQQESTKEDLTQAYATLYPSISATGTLSKNYSTNLSGGDYDYDKQTYSLSLSQTVYDHRAFVARDMAELLVESGESDLKLAQQALILRVTNAYFDVLLADDSYQLNQHELKAISRQLEQAQQRYEVGIIAITEVLTAQAGYDKTLASSLKSENDLKIAHEQLKEITSTTFDHLAQLDNELSLLPPEPQDINHWVNLALENNPSIVSLSHQRDSMKKNIKLKKAERYPSVNLSANYQYSDTNGPLSSSARAGSDAGINLSVSLPIYRGGNISSQVRQSQYDYEVIHSKLDELQRSIARQTRNYYLSVLSNIAQVKALKQAVISAQSSLDATEAGYNVGTQTIVDMLNIQQDLYEAKQQLSAAQYNYVKAMIALKQTAGVINEQDLADTSQWFK